tara:strand:+ start:90 stop:344 length:255 start_codon:yes stop_codon:yes gene_type:complete
MSGVSIASSMAFFSVTLIISSSSALLLKNNTIIIEVIARPMMTKMGIGSSSSLTKGAPIVADLLTRMIMLMAVAFLAKGRTLSS